MNEGTKLTRKSFLKLSGGATAGLMLGACGTSGEVSSAPRPSGGYYHGLKVGMHTYTLRNFNLKQAVKITQELGLRYIGLNPKHLALKSSPQEIAEAKKMVADAGLQFMGVGVIGFSAKDPDPRKIFDYAKSVGFSVISASPDQETLDDLDLLVVEYGIKIAIHNHGPKDKWPTPEILLDAIKDHHPSVGACVDTGHYKRAGVDPHRAIRLLGERVHDVHLKDVDAAEEKGKSVVMGTGVVNVKEMMKALLDINFQRHAAIEYEAEPENPIAGVQKSLAHIQNCLDQLG